MKRTTLAALALLAACAPAAGPQPSAPDPTPATSVAPATAAALNPVGVYEFTAFGRGEEVARGTIEITGQPGAYGGRIHVEDESEEAAITRVTVSGQEMTMNAATPDGPMTITLTFTGDTFLGRYSVDDESGELRGRRRP